LRGKAKIVVTVVARLCPSGRSLFRAGGEGQAAHLGQDGVLAGDDRFFVGKSL